MWVIGFVRYVRIKKTLGFRLLERDIRLLFFSFMLSTRWRRRKKEERDGPLNLAIKLQWASFFLESSIMINDQINKKNWSSLELYSINIVDVVRCDMWLCCLVFCSKTINKAPMSFVLFKIIDHDWWSIQ